MATTDDLPRYGPIFRELARLLFERAAETESWQLALLDVRFDENGGYIYKIRVTRPSGEITSPTAPAAFAYQLIELMGLRPTGTDRWYGLKVKVTSAGECEVKFDYDPACVDAPDFFDS